MDTLLVALFVCSPAILFGVLFLVSFIREPRQFRNAIWLLLFLLSSSTLFLLRFGQEWMVMPILLLIVITPAVVILFLIINAGVVIHHEGLSFATLLPGLFAFALISYILLYPLLAIFHAPSWLITFGSLIVVEGFWFFFTFTALLLYSWLYRILPRKRVYDFIIVHGAGLLGDKPTPLLKGRLDKALKLWNKQHQYGKLIVSGGKGSDEIVSEAEAMNNYYIHECQVPQESVLLENRSTTTMENLKFSKELIASLGFTGPKSYRAALVTSDYHVFRASEYAHQIGLTADGVGSHTKGYYWPTAFIREFVAISKSHMWPYYVIAGFWVVGEIYTLVEFFTR